MLAVTHVVDPAVGEVTRPVLDAMRDGDPGLDGSHVTRNRGVSSALRPAGCPARPWLTRQPRT